MNPAPVLLKELWSRTELRAPAGPLMHSRCLTCRALLLLRACRRRADPPTPPEKEKPDLSMQETREVRALGPENIFGI